MMQIEIGRTRPEFVASFTNAVSQSIEAGEIGLQVAVYAGDELVVDMSAGIADVATGRPVTADTLFPTFSVIKAVTAVALHIQAARGAVDYDAPVARYWPEFGSNGKEKVTVRHVLQHRSGVWQMPAHVTPELMCDYDWMCRQIAALAPKFEPGTRNGYQSLTFGWMVAEIVRRTDAKGRSFRAFVRDEILAPLAIDDLWMGVPASDHNRVARLIDAPPRPLPPDAPPFLAIPFQVGTREEIFGRADVRESCNPGAGGFTTAPCMARFFAMLANGGILDGVRILPDELVKTFSEPRPDADQPDDVHGVPLRIGAGFWLGGNLEPANLGRIAGRNPRILSHPGAGCSIAWADPDKRIAVSISHNRMCLPPATAQDPIRHAITEAFDAA